MCSMVFQSWSKCMGMILLTSCFHCLPSIWVRWACTWPNHQYWLTSCWQRSLAYPCLGVGAILYWESYYVQYIEAAYPGLSFMPVSLRCNLVHQRTAIFCWHSKACSCCAVTQGQDAARVCQATCPTCTGSTCPCPMMDWEIENLARPWVKLSTTRHEPSCGPHPIWPDPLFDWSKQHLLLIGMGLSPWDASPGGPCRGGMHTGQQAVHGGCPWRPSCPALPPARPAQPGALQSVHIHPCHARAVTHRWPLPFWVRVSC